MNRGNNSFRGDLSILRCQTNPIFVCVMPVLVPYACAKWMSSHLHVYIYIYAYTGICTLEPPAQSADIVLSLFSFFLSLLSPPQCVPSSSLPPFAPHPPHPPRPLSPQSPSLSLSLSLSLSFSIPFNSPFMSLSFFWYVRFIFHVCPVLSLQDISLHLPSCRLVSLSFVSISFPLHTPCFHFCPVYVPFSSPLFSFNFPLLSRHVDFLFPPLISLHFLAFPLCSPVFARKQKRGFPAFSQRGRQKNTEFFQIFGKRRQETQTSKEPAGGFEPGTLVLQHG